MFTNGGGYITGFATVPLNTLTHVKISRSGGLYRTGLAGVEDGSSPFPLDDTLGGFVIGTLADASNPGAAGRTIPGHIVAARVTLGVDRYPGSTYTPDAFPFPTS